MRVKERAKDINEHQQNQPAPQNRPERAFEVHASSYGRHCFDTGKAKPAVRASVQPVRGARSVE